MEKPAKTRKPYTSDLTDAQWELVEPLIPTNRIYTAFFIVINR